MPTAALHSQYWAGSADAPDPPDPPETGDSANNGYVPWQTTVVIGGGFGVTQVVWEWLVARRDQKGTR